MKTTFDQDDILYALLVSSALKTTITGGVYKCERPAGSQVEDVVINSLPISEGSAQLGTSNVNIHVPDIQLSVNGVMHYQPDLKRMRALMAVSKPILENVFGTYYNFWVEYQGLYKDSEGTNNHYINFRIQFKIHNS